MRRFASISRRRWLAAGAALGATALLPARTSHAGTLGVMATRAIPGTGERLPVIGLGTNRYYAGDLVNLRRLRDTLLSFARNGGKVIDTAPAYGESQRIIGDILGEAGLVSRLFLATKVDRENPVAAEASIARSLKLLNTPRIDLMQLHNLRGVDTTLPLLREQQAAGRIRYIGITSARDKQYEEMEAVIRREPLDFIQIDYAVGNRSAADRLLPLAADRGMATLISLPFGGGRQFAAVEGHPLPPLAAEIGCRSWAQLFLKYVLSHPAVTCVIPGTTQPAHVEENLHAGHGPLPDAAMRRAIERHYDAIVGA
ncbi:MAG TPA: aldo/keto reductase [Rhodocyclaceae bacterium]